MTIVSGAVGNFKLKRGLATSPAKRGCRAAQRVASLPSSVLSNGKALIRSGARVPAVAIFKETR